MVRDESEDSRTSRYWVFALMTEFPFPIIETEGTPYEMGVQHGQAARTLVHASFRRLCPPEERTDERRARATMIERTIAAQMPQAVQEMHGIADGTGMPYEDVLLMNLCFELWAEAVWTLPSRCTTVGMAGTEPMVAKTMDMAAGDDDYVICHRARPTTGYEFLHLTWAGTVWTSGGVNSAGLAHGTSLLQSNRCEWSNFPLFVMTRYLLQSCATVSEAIEMSRRFDAINCGDNILLGDSSGDLAVIEKTVAQAVRRLGAEPKSAGQEAALVFATNHSVTAEMESLLGGSEAFLANSRQRFENMTRLAGRVSKDLTAMISVLRDHTSPGGICQHGQGGLHTTGALVALPKEAKLWVVRGYPCRSEFWPVNLARQRGLS